MKPQGKKVSEANSMLKQLKLSDTIGKTVRNAAHFGFDKERLIVVFDDGYVHFVAHCRDDYDFPVAIEYEKLYLGGYDSEKLVELGIATAEEVVAERDEREAKRLALVEANERMEYERLAVKYGGAKLP